MKCPACQAALEQRMGPSGILIDVCAVCKGVWLDKGEIYYYVKNQKRLYEVFVEAYKTLSPGNRLCPRCQAAMFQAKFPNAGPLIDACQKCEGTWFDDGEVKALNMLLDGKIDPQGAVAAPARPAAAPASAASPTPRPSASVVSGAALAGLPSLAFRSAVVLGSLYSVLAAFSFVAVALLQIDLGWAFLSAAVGIFINFLIGPWLMDLSMRWAHAFRWIDPQDLPPHLRVFINSTCVAKKIPFPRVGIIADQNPNAFTYGRTPGDARLVVTQGVLDMLDEEELEAVVGHEIGHIVHWDMLVMTIAALVPLVLYGIYKVCMKYGSRRSSSDKGGNPLPLIGFIALILYYLTEYVVLFLSRTRELHADRFSGEVTGAPNKLSSALVKIAYGLAGHREAAEEGVAAAAEGNAARTLGIFDPIGAKALVAGSMGPKGAPSKENILGAMQWDVWNPWAKYYELGSTHPLPAHRIELLGQQAEAYGQEPFVKFDLQPPEDYWGPFFIDIFMLWQPVLLAAGAPLGAFLLGGVDPTNVLWAAAGAWSLGHLLTLSFSYGTGDYPPMNVAGLLKRVKVSKVRGIPVSIKGKVIGRGIPGFLISEDIVIQDETGFLFVDYSQPLAIFQWIFAIRRVPQLIGREVVLEGWYRRAPVPYLELRSLTADGDVSTCWSLEAQYVFYLGVAAVAAAKLLGF